MKKQFLSFLLVVSFVFSVSAQRAVAPRTDPTEANIRKHIEYLASDKLEGRRTGEQGATFAAGYIANNFANLRLKPGARSKNGKANYMQTFPYVTGVELAPADNAFSLELTTANGQRIKVDNMVPAKAVGFSPNGSAQNAKIVYGGFGIIADDPKYNDYKYDDADIDVKGKVVLVFDGTPDSDKPSDRFTRFDVRTKSLIAKEHGAVGMLIISRETDYSQDKLSRLTYDQTLGEAAIPTFIISRNTAQNILGVGESDMKTIEGLTAAKATPGVTTHVGFRDTQPVVSFKVNLIKKQAEAYNIIGILPGNDPVLKDEAIVIGAHYDHLGRGGQGSLAANSTDIHHGADDNASGTAAIIEMARRFVGDKKNKRTIIFIAFSGEEEGLFGSKYYVNNPVFPLDKTIAMINLDMVGRLNENKLTIGGIGTASEWKDVAEGLNKCPPHSVEMSLCQIMTLQLNEDGFGPSDHSSFYGKKIPVLFFFTGSHADYHKPSDTADKINYGGELTIVNYVETIAKAIDQNPKRPTYAVAKSSVSGGRATFNISLGSIPSYAESSDGLVLDGVRDNSPAAKAGLKAGDKIVKLAGHDIRNVSDYTFVLGEMKAGQEYEVEIVRGAERVRLKITPVKRQ